MNRPRTTMSPRRTEMASTSVSRVPVGRSPVPVPAHAGVAGVLLQALSEPVPEVSSPVVSALSGGHPSIEPLSLRQAAPQGLRRVWPAGDGLSVSVVNIHHAPSPTGAALTPRPEAPDAAFRGTSRGEYTSPDSTVPPASSPAPARSHAWCASGRDAQTVAQVGSLAERAFAPVKGDHEVRLAGYMRRLGLHEAPGDIVSGTSTVSPRDGPVEANAGMPAGISADSYADVAQHMLRGMSAPGVGAQANAPAEHAWVKSQVNQEVQL
jgi:hypothetical protein